MRRDVSWPALLIVPVRHVLALVGLGVVGLWIWSRKRRKAEPIVAGPVTEEAKTADVR